MFNENTLLRERTDDQCGHIAYLRGKVGEMNQERSRLRAGRVVPVWVASSLDQRVSQPEQRQNNLEMQVADMLLERESILRSMHSADEEAEQARMTHPG